MTPAESEVSYDVEPSDLADATPQRNVVARTIEQLQSIYPDLREVADVPVEASHWSSDEFLDDL